MKVQIKVPLNHLRQVHFDVPIPRMGEWIVVHKVGEVPLRVQEVNYNYTENSVLVLVM